MKITEIISELEKTGTWVNYNKSRDYVLQGDPNQKVLKIGVCWMATTKAIKQAIEEGVNFIVSHENPFYQATTSPDKIYLESANYKRELLNSNNICLYRCHDYWDRLPEIGVTDIWAKLFELDFKQRNINSFESYATFTKRPIKDIAKKIATKLAPYGQDTVQVFGNPDQEVESLALGTGAATNVPLMLKNNPQAIVVSDDGCMTYEGIQYCLDNEIPVIRVNHAQCEIPGIETMVDYFTKNYNIETIYLEEGYKATSISNK